MTVYILAIIYDWKRNWAAPDLGDPRGPVPGLPTKVGTPPVFMCLGICETCAFRLANPQPLNRFNKIQHFQNLTCWKIFKNFDFRLEMSKLKLF